MQVLVLPAISWLGTIGKEAVGHLLSAQCFIVCRQHGLLLRILCHELILLLLRSALKSGLWR